MIIVVTIGCVGGGKGYLDYQLFKDYTFSYLSLNYSCKPKDSDLLKDQKIKTYLSKLQSYDYIRQQLDHPDPLLYKLIDNCIYDEDIDSVKRELDSLIADKRDIYLEVNTLQNFHRLVDHKISGYKICLVFPLEKTETVMGRALHNYVTKNTPFPSLQTIPKQIHVDQDLLADNIQSCVFDIVILYDNVKHDPVMMIECDKDITIKGCVEKIELLSSRKLRDLISRLQKCVKI